MVSLFFKFYLFVFGCAGSLPLPRLSLVATHGGYSPVAVHGVLTTVTSPVAEHRFQEARASAVAAQGLRS